MVTAYLALIKRCGRLMRADTSRQPSPQPSHSHSPSPRPQPPAPSPQPQLRLRMAHRSGKVGLPTVLLR